MTDGAAAKARDEPQRCTKDSDKAASREATASHVTRCQQTRSHGEVRGCANARLRTKPRWRTEPRRMYRVTTIAHEATLMHEAAMMHEATAIGQLAKALNRDLAPRRAVHWSTKSGTPRNRSIDVTSSFLSSSFLLCGNCDPGRATSYRIISDISPAPYWVSALLSQGSSHIRLALSWHCNVTSSASR